MIVRRGLRVLRIGSLVVPVLAALVWGLALYRAALRATSDHVLVQSQLIAQHVESVVEAQRVLHRAVAARLALEPPGFAASPAFQYFLREVTAAQPSLVRLQYVTLQGRIVADSSALPAGQEAEALGYLDAVRRGQDVWIGRAVASDGDVFLIASPIRVPGVAPGARAIIVSMLDTAVLQEFLRDIAVRDGEAASIARRDGMLLLRNFDADPTMLPPTALGRTRPLAAAFGSFEATAVTDGVRRIYGFHWGDGLPIFANFGVPKSYVWWDLWRRGGPMLALFAVMGVFLWVTAERLRRGVSERLAYEASRKRAETAERLADQRIHLMRETHHRVKNNLALVVSLINLQTRGEGGVDADALKARIGAISHVHDLMHQASDAVHVDFAAMLADIARSPAVVPRESGITVQTDLQPGILLGPDRITPLSVIAAELLTNAVKHAFTGRSAGMIRLHLFRDGSDVVLDISDDGVGLDLMVSRRSGSAIIDALVDQIDGSLTRISKGGLQARLRFAVG